jgi:hypothetical protein
MNEHVWTYLTILSNTSVTFTDAQEYEKFSHSNFISLVTLFVTLSVTQMRKVTNGDFYRAQVCPLLATGLQTLRLGMMMQML